METIPDLVSRDRRSDDTAIVRPDPTAQPYTYHRFCTQSWKAGNVLRHLGVGDGTPVGVAGDRAVQPLLAMVGVSLLGGVVRLAPPQSVDARAVIAHVGDVGSYELPDGGQRAGYGDSPDSPATYHFEQELWSENPTRVPRKYDPTAPVLDDGERRYSHRGLLSAAREVVETLDLSADDRVRVQGRFDDPRTVVAGVFAPLSVGGAVVLDSDTSSDVTVVAPDATANAAADRVFSAAAVDLEPVS